MIEAGVVVVTGNPVYWHLPPNRTGGSLPDSRALWDVLWNLRKEEGLGFAHSHPGSGTPGPSWTDLTTFSSIERGLGRRLNWWITSSNRVIHLSWMGPEELDYVPVTIEQPMWADELRRLSVWLET